MDTHTLARRRLARLAAACAILFPAAAQSALVPSAEEVAAWITAEDYPADTAARGKGGEVLVQYRIVDGRARECRVLRSSAPPALAERTCALAQERALYSQAAGGAQRPDLADRLTVNWDPRQRAPIVKRERNGGATYDVSARGVSDYDYNDLVGKLGSADVTVFYTIGPNGRIAECGITRSSGDAAVDRYTCAVMIRNLRFRMPAEADGTVLSRIGVDTVAWRRPPGWAPGGSGRGGRLPRGGVR